MKLKKDIESYDVKSLRDLDEGVTKMKKHCENLCMLGKFLESKIQAARANGFQDVNTDRAEELIKEYLKKMSYAEREYSELSVSVKDFIRKIEDIWSPWR